MRYKPEYGFENENLVEMEMVKILEGFYGGPDFRIVSLKAKGRMKYTVEWSKCYSRWVVCRDGLLMAAFTSHRQAKRYMLTERAAEERDERARGGVVKLQGRQRP